MFFTLLLLLFPLVDYTRLVIIISHHNYIKLMFGFPIFCATLIDYCAVECRGSVLYNHQVVQSRSRISMLGNGLCNIDNDY